MPQQASLESNSVTPLPEEAEWLGFESTVPRALVHKQAVSEVLVTDTRAVGEDTVLCAAELPALHRLHGPRDGHHDLMGIAEATRQAAEVVAHRHLEVPHGRVFVFREIGLRAVDPAALLATESPARLVLRIEVANRQQLGGSLASFDLSGTLHLDGRPAAVGNGSCMFVAPEDYAALRAGASARPTAEGRPGSTGDPPRADPGLVGRDPRDVVLGPPTPRGEATEAALVVDQTHPSFFDHSHDHVPGPLLLEGMRQLALARACALSATESSEWLPTRCAVRFERFAELDRPLLLAAEGGGGGGTFEFSLRAEQESSVARGSMAVERV